MGAKGLSGGLACGSYWAWGLRRGILVVWVEAFLKAQGICSITIINPMLLPLGEESWGADLQCMGQLNATPSEL